jgi:prophage DNA circulation protein
MPQPQTAFQASLLPASFKGVSFGVDASSVSVGRRSEEHEYPFRDTPYGEDLGRRAIKIQFTAFLIGDNVAAQSLALQAVLQQKGAGPLVHPSYGSIMMMVDERAVFSESKDKGRLIEVSMSFVEPGQALYPTSATDTQQATSDAADNADSAASSDWQTSITNSDANKVTT